MRNLWLEAFTICLLFVITQVSTEQVVCRNCEGFQICGLKTSQTPDCPNGFPCTKEQYQLCTKITMARENGKCDRPGVFAESTSPNKFYMCKIKDRSLKFEKKPITCPENTIFDLSTMRCLSENEKILLKVAKKVTVAYGDNQFKFYCMKSGTFPDPSDCKMYHVCNSKLESQDFYCPLGAYFNGTNCTRANAEQCIQQFKKQFQDQIVKAKALFQNVKYLLSKTSPTPRRLESSASLVSPGVIKRTFYDKNKTKYTYYGIKESTNSSDYNNTKTSVDDFERFVENIIAQHEMEKNSSVILSELKSASKSITGTYVQNATLVATESGRKLCKSNKKPDKAKNFKRKITLNKVTIIFITQNKCESCSSCQTTAKPVVPGNILNVTIPQEKEFSNTRPSHSEADVTDHIDTSPYTHMKATALDAQHIYDTTNSVLGIKETDSAQYTRISDSPLSATMFEAQDMHSSSAADFESETTLVLTGTSQYSGADSSSQFTETTYANQGLSSSESLQAGTPSELYKITTDKYSDTNKWLQAQQITSYDQVPFISTKSDLETQSAAMKTSASQKLDNNASIQPVETTESQLETESTALKRSTTEYFYTNSFEQDTNFPNQEYSNSKSSESEKESDLLKTSSGYASGIDFSTSLDQEFFSSKLSDSETEYNIMRTSGSQSFDTSVTTQSIGTTDKANSDLETESVISKTSINEFSAADSNSHLLVTSPANEEFFTSKFSDIEKETIFMKTSTNKYFEQQTTFSASGYPSDSEKISVTMKNSTGRYADTYPFLQSEKTTFSHGKLPSSKVSNLEIENTFIKTSPNQFFDFSETTKSVKTTGRTNSDLGAESTLPKASTNQISDYHTGQIIPVDEGFSKDITSDSQTDFTFIATSAKYNYDAESTPHISKSTSVNQRLSSSRPLQSDTPSEFIKTTLKNTSPQVEQITSFGQVLSSNTGSNSQITPAIMKISIGQFSETESATESLETTFSDHELSISKISDSTASVFMKTSENWDTIPLLTETIYGDQDFSSSEVAESEIKSTSEKSNASLYSDTKSVTHSEGATSSNQEFYSNGVSESEQDNAEIKINTEEPFYSVKESYSGIKATKATNSIRPPTKNYDEPSPQSTEAIFELQEPLNSYTFQSELDNTQVKIKTTEMLFTSEAPHLGLNTSASSIVQPPDSVSSPGIEGVTSKSQKADLELGSTFKTMSNSQSSKEVTYSNLKDTTPIIHSTKADSELAEVSMSSTTSQQHLGSSTTANSNTNTFFAENNHPSSTLGPEWTTNPALTGASINPDTNTSNSIKTINSNQDFVYSTTQVKQTGKPILTATNPVQNSFVSLYPHSQNITIIMQNLPNSTTLLLGTTKINKDQYSDIGTFQITKLSSYNPSSQDSTIAEAEMKITSLIEDPLQDIQNSVTPYAKEVSSAVQYSYGSSTQTAAMKTSINIHSHTLSSPYVESTLSITEDLQNSKITESEVEIPGMSVSTAPFLDTSKSSHSKITASPTADIYGSSETKSAVTGTDLSQHTFINAFYSSETTLPNQGVFSNALLDSEKDTSTKAITSAQYPHPNQYTYLEDTIFTTPTLKSETVRTSTEFSTDQHISFVTSQYTKMTSSNQNAYASESFHTTETTSDENVSSITTERGVDKMKSNTTEIFSTSTLPESTAANFVQVQHISATVKSEIITSSEQTNINQHTDTNTTPPSVQSASNQELFSNAVFSSQTRTASTKPSYNGPLQEFGDSSFAIPNLNKSSTGETGEEATSVISSTTEVFQNNTEIYSTSTSRDYYGNYSEKLGKTTDLNEAINSHQNTFSTFPHLVKSTSDQEQLSSTVIKLEARPTLSRVNISQYPQGVISPHDTIFTIEDDRYSSKLTSKTEPPTTKVNPNLYSEKHSSVPSPEMTFSGKEYLGSGNSDSRTESSLKKTSTSQETNFIHSEEGILQNQELPISTASDSSSTGQFSYSNSFIQSIKTISEGYSSNGALYLETGTTLKKTSTNRLPDISAVSDLEGTIFSSQGTNSPKSLLSETENTIMETSADQFSGTDSFIHFAETTSADQRLSNNLPTNSGTESAFIKSTTKKYLEIGSSKSEDIPLLNQKLISSTMTDSSSDSHISYTDSSTENVKSNSGNQIHSVSTGSNLQEEFTVMETSTGQFSDSNPFNQFNEEPSASQEFSSSNPLDIKTTLLKTNTNDHFLTNSFEQPPSINQEFSSSTVSESEKEAGMTLLITGSGAQNHSGSKASESEASSVMKTSTSQYFDNNVTIQTIERTDYTNSNSEPEATIMKTSTSHYLDNIAPIQPLEITNSDLEAKDYPDVNSFIHSTEKSSSDGIISSSTDLEPEFETNTLTIEPEAKSTVISIKTSQHSNMDSTTQNVVTAFSNVVVPSRTSLQTEREFTSMKFSTNQYSDRVSFVLSDKKTASDVLLPSSVPYDSESVITSQHAYVTKPSELDDSSFVPQSFDSAFTEEIEVNPSSAISSIREYSDTGSSTQSKEISSSDVIFSNNAALDSGVESTLAKTSTEYPHITPPNTSLQLQDTTEFIRDMSTLKSERETSHAEVTLNQESNIEILTESSTLVHSGSVALESETESNLMVTREKPIYSSTQFQDKASVPEEIQSNPTPQSDITDSKVSVNQHSEVGKIQKPTETILSNEGSSSGTTLSLKTDGASAEYSTSIIASSQSTETVSSDNVLINSTALNSESEIILTKSSTRWPPNINASLELKITSTTQNTRGPSDSELVPQSNLTKKSTNQYSGSDSFAMSTKLISETETPLIKTSSSKYSGTHSSVEFLETTFSNEEIFKSTNSDSERESAIMKSSTIKYSDNNIVTLDKKTTSSNSIISSSTGGDLIFSKATTSQYSGTDFSTESKQISVSDEAPSNSVALESKKEVTLMKTTTSRYPRSSIFPEMKEVTLGVEDIHNGFTSAGVDTTFVRGATNQFPDTELFTLHFKSTLPNPDISSELGKDTRTTKLDNGQIQTGGSQQYIDLTFYTQDVQDLYSFSSLGTETKHTVGKASTKQHPHPSTSLESLNITYATQNMHSSLTAVTEVETIPTKINVSKPPHIKPSQSDGTTFTIQNVDVNTLVNSEAGATETEIKTSKISSTEPENLSSTYGVTTVDSETETIHTQPTPVQQSHINSPSTKMAFPHQEFFTVTPDSETEKTHIKTSKKQQSAFDSSSQIAKATSLGQEVTSSTVLESESGTSLKETSTILHPYISASPEVEVKTSLAQSTQGGLSLESETLHREVSTSHPADIGTLQSMGTISANQDFSFNEADVTLEKLSFSEKPSITTPPQSIEMISADQSISTGINLNSKTVSTLIKINTSKFPYSGSPHLEYSTFTLKDITGSSVSESEKENTLIKTSTSQYSDTDRLPQSVKTVGDQYTSRPTRQPLLFATPQIQNSHNSTSAAVQTEKIVNQYQTNTPLSKTTLEFQDLHSSALEENDLTTSPLKKSTNLNLNHSFNPKVTAEFQNVNINMNVEAEISAASKKTSTSSTLVYSSAPPHSGRTTSAGLKTTFPHSFVGTSPQSLMAASQTENLYSSTRSNLERQTVPTKINTAEHPDISTTLHSTKMSITKASTTNHSDFNELSYLKENTPTGLNIDGGITEESETIEPIEPRTVSTKYSSDETFYTSTESLSESVTLTQDHHTSTILESETTTERHTRTVHSINNASRTSDNYSTTASTPQLTSTIALKKISTSQNGSTSSSLRPKATTATPEDLDVSMSVESETTTTLTKTNTSHSPDFSKTTVLKKATSPPQEMKTVSKKTNNVETILNSITPQSKMTATATTPPSHHLYISSFPYANGTASQIQNIHRNLSVESETAALPKKVSSTNYFNFSTLQTQNFDLGLTPQLVTMIVPNTISTSQNLKISASNSSKVESETFSKIKTNTTEHANSNIKKNTSQADFLGSTLLHSEKGTDSAATTTVNTFYNTSKPFLEKITIPTSVVQHSNSSTTPPPTAVTFSAPSFINNKTSLTLPRGPSASILTTLPFSTDKHVNAKTTSLSNISSNFVTNQSTFHYSYTSVMPYSKETVFSTAQNVANKTITLQQNETSFSRGIHISTTFRPTQNSKSDFKRKPKVKSKISSKKKSKNRSKGKSKNKSKGNSKKIFKKKRTKTFRCTRVGLFRDPNDCHSYYRCRFVSIKNKKCPFCKSKRWKLIATHKKCEGGKWFSSLFWRCVKIRPLLC